ncbi:LPXTG cell wall anchor domain-containing protein [uncultured Vagococcus sp.]|uniref:LPXTG cell wall anchor domain-containing protein n=1 Tax=uncultured Vagococcus sp. TaxID=189676 RepID=UPI0028D290B2|nr:LPXTG cell wall anchor domain-containing protein [uncultured Vagococcus sp.]
MKNSEKIFYSFLMISMMLGLKGVAFAEETNQESRNNSLSDVSLVVTKKEVNSEPSSQKIIDSKKRQSLPQTNESEASGKYSFVGTILMGSLLVLLKNRKNKEGL